MTPEALERLCEDARRRLKQHINRSAAQHSRRIREQRSKPAPIESGMNVWFVGDEPTTEQTS